MNTRSTSSTKSKAAAPTKVVSPTDSSSTANEAKVGAASPANAKVGAVGKLLCFLFYLISFSIYLILL